VRVVVVTVAELVLLVVEVMLEVLELVSVVVVDTVLVVTVFVEVVSVALEVDVLEEVVDDTVVVETHAVPASFGNKNVPSLWQVQRTPPLHPDLHPICAD